jgi:predicted GNAT superfamily acetyltransferase
MTTPSLSLKLEGEITIRRAETVADYRACQAAQRQAWGITEDGYVIPVATMVGANLHGGLVLGAFLPGGEAVALSFAFLGRSDGRLCHYSQLTGVVPAYQSRGLGYQIKMMQREFARAEGIDRIAWAFDPLQAGNAHFNLTRLGATAGRYVANMYGERTDALNDHVPTDRLIVEWETESECPAILGPEATTAMPRLIQTDDRWDGRSRPLRVDQDAVIDQTRVLLEVPREIATLRRDAPDSAEAWRVAVGEAFQVVFQAGFRAVHFVRDESSEFRRGFYVLERTKSK